MAKKQTFEEALERLEAIVERLEGGKTPLEESISLYEEGMRIGKTCRSLLDEAEQRIRTLTAELEEE
ncbi:MAG: exodeoxyribonuclease VII small subunit [Candidatus Krumholzibacteriota bacterium]|nr:exodeoxyribonuclease VII small subunit [Candidatus Krumholzibacteriota bacterium]